MKELLKRILLFSGILSIILPVVIGVLWYRYVQEQESQSLVSVPAGRGCEPYSFTLERIEQKLQVQWKTVDECASFLLMGRSYNDFSNLPYKILSASGETPAREHVVNILPSDEAQYQYLVVVSAGEWYGVKGNPFRYRE